VDEDDERLTPANVGTSRRAGVHSVVTRPHL
jgi:hypothetical protein